MLSAMKSATLSAKRAARQACDENVRAKRVDFFYNIIPQFLEMKKKTGSIYKKTH